VEIGQKPSFHAAFGHDPAEQGIGDASPIRRKLLIGSRRRWRCTALSLEHQKTKTAPSSR